MTETVRLSPQLERIAREHCGAAPAAVEPLHSMCNDVFRLRFDRGASRILKIYSRAHGADRRQRGDRNEVERDALALLERHGIPSPRVEAFDGSGESPWVLMQDMGSCAAGRTTGLTRPEAMQVFQRCGEALAAVHQIVPTDVSSLWRHPSLESPRAVADPVLRWCLGRAESHPLASTDLLEQFQEAALSSSVGATLCHGDFHPDQCVREGAHLSAIVDWESALFGDPTVDHAKLANYLYIFFKPDSLRRPWLDMHPTVPLPKLRTLVICPSARCTRSHSVRPLSRMNVSLGHGGI